MQKTKNQPVRGDLFRNPRAMETVLANILDTEAKRNEEECRRKSSRSLSLPRRQKGPIQMVASRQKSDRETRLKTKMKMKIDAYGFLFCWW